MLTALAEFPGLVPSTHMAAQICNSSSRGYDASSDPVGLLHTGGAHIHLGTHSFFLFFLSSLDGVGEHFSF